MMTLGPTQFADDSESLQADVMRFMAIIAFCIIAILALVRNVEPAPASANPTRSIESVATAKSVAIAESVAEVVEPKLEPNWRVPIEKPRPLPVSHESTPIPRETRKTERVASIAQPTMQPPVAQPTVVFDAPVDTEALRSEPEPSPETTVAESTRDPAASPADEPGLTLRFASDGDFLRLIAKGGIKVYAFSQSDILSLNDSYRFLESRTPGQVYELLKESIPSLIVDALRRERNDIGTFTWGIALPDRISRQIDRQLQTVTSGQLVIDRYGDVHHVSAS